MEYFREHCSDYMHGVGMTFDDVYYRLTALRELYEETGILLARPLKEMTTGSKIANNREYPYFARIPSIHHSSESTNEDESQHGVSDWRDKVVNDAFAFEGLLREHKWMPDIGALVPWARLYVNILYLSLSLCVCVCLCDSVTYFMYLS